MRFCLVHNGKILANETGLESAEVLEYAKTVLETGLPLSIGNRLTFRTVGDVVFCLPSKFDEEEASHILRSILLDLRPYPDWIVEISKGRRISGFHTVVLVSGPGRFELREKLTRYASLVENTGKEDVYVSKGIFKPEIEADGVFISHGEDFLENLRRVFVMERFTDGKGIKSYEDLPMESFNGSDSIRGILKEKKLTDLGFLVSAAAIFKEELLDLRSPIEIAWILGG